MAGTFSEGLLSKAYLFRVRSHERRNELTPAWDFKSAWKQVMFTWSSILAAFQNDPIFWWTCIGISFRLVLSTEIKFHFCQNDRMKSIPGLSFQCTCALNAASNKSTLIYFVSDKLCSHENLMPVWNVISVKMTDIKSIPFWGSFHLNSCEHK